jgi:hypothetical protein
MGLRGSRLVDLTEVKLLLFECPPFPVPCLLWFCVKKSLTLSCYETPLGFVFDLVMIRELDPHQTEDI